MVVVVVLVGWVGVVVPLCCCSGIITGGGVGVGVAGSGDVAPAGEGEGVGFPLGAVAAEGGAHLRSRLVVVDVAGVGDGDGGGGGGVVVVVQDVAVLFDAFPNAHEPGVRTPLAEALGPRVVIRDGLSETEVLNKLQT
jgi:hypothetical protein